MRGSSGKYNDAVANPVLRKKLPPRHAPYYYVFRECYALGYYKPRPNVGMWKWKVTFSENCQRERVFANADDEQDANGIDILTFTQALKEAEALCRKVSKFNLRSPENHVGPRTEMIICPCGPVYTVGHALAEFLDWARKFGAKQTFKSALTVTNRFVVPCMATIPIDDLTPQHFYDMMYNIEATPIDTVSRRKGRMIDPEKLDPEARRRRRVSANNVLAVVRGALNKAWEEGKIADDRAWRCVRSYRGVQKPRADILTRKECILLLKQCKSDFQQLVLGALYTGCRITELLNMRAEDVSSERMAVFVRPIKTYRSRSVAVPEEGYKFFRSLTRGKGRSNPLFIRSSGKPWVGRLHCEELQVAMERAGLPREFVFHSLRHTYASLRLQEGVSPLAVARQLGHKGIRTVMEIYAHCADDFIDREIRERFEPILAGDEELTLIIAGEAEGDDNSVLQSEQQKIASHLRVV